MAPEAITATGLHKRYGDVEALAGLDIAVGKGTVFHRFGNRTGLMYALMVERAQALEEAATAGPPPLGPGATERDRLLAFLDAIIEVVGRNKSLLAELAYSAAPDPPPEKATARHRDDHPVYRFWHGHISTLISAAKEAGVKLVIIEPFRPRKTAERVAADIGAQLVIIPEKVGGNPQTGDYIGLFDYDLNQIVNALKNISFEARNGDRPVAISYATHPKL